MNSYSPEQQRYQNLLMTFNSYNSVSIGNSSTPLSINKSQSEFNQQCFHNYQTHHQFSPLSLTQNRNIKKSFTPYPTWNTAQENRNKNDESLMITDYQLQANKENIAKGMQISYKYQNENMQNQSPHILRIPLEQKQQSSQNSKKNLQISNESKKFISQSIKKAIQSSNVKTTVNLGNLLIENEQGSDFYSNILSASKKSRKSQRYHIEIQQSISSPNDIQSSSLSINQNMANMDEKPNEQIYQFLKGSVSEGNEIIEYFLTEEDSQTQLNDSNEKINIDNDFQYEFNNLIDTNSVKGNRSAFKKKQHQNDTKQRYCQLQDKKMFQKQNVLQKNYADILEGKIKQLSNNIEILHNKFTSKLPHSYSDQSPFIVQQNKKHSTMQSWDSKPDTSSTTINQKPASSLQIEPNNQFLLSKFNNEKSEKKQKRLIYHDSKIIFSKNDSGFVDFSQEFSQILNQTQSQNSISQSKYSQNQASPKVIYNNSPVSIEISQQFQNLFGNTHGKSETVSKKSYKSNQSLNSQNQNSQGKQKYSENSQYLMQESESNFNPQKSIFSDSFQEQITNKNGSFRLSFPKVLIKNHSQISQSDIQDSNLKNKQENSFVSQSANQTFIQQQFNKKFNTKFNQWLMS